MITLCSCKVSFSAARMSHFGGLDCFGALAILETVVRGNAANDLEVFII